MRKVSIVVWVKNTPSRWSCLEMLCEDKQQIINDKYTWYLLTKINKLSMLLSIFNHNTQAEEAALPGKF